MKLSRTKAGPASGWRIFLPLSFLAGLVVVLAVQLTGLLTLLGDISQAVYVLAGLILGAVLLPLFGPVLVRKTPAPLIISGGISLAVGGLLWGINTYDPVAPNPDLLARSFAASVGTLFVSALYFKNLGPGVRRRYLVLRALSLGILPAALTVLYALVYVISSYTVFPTLVLLTEAIAALVLLSLWVIPRFSMQKIPRDSPKDQEAGKGAGKDRPAEGKGAAVQWHGLVRPSFPGRRPKRAVAALTILLGVVLAVPGNLGGWQTVDASSPVRDLTARTVHTEATPLRHVVEIMLENRAFDNFFGTYPEGASGSPAAGVSQPLNLLNLTRPWPVSPVPNGSFVNNNPVEGYTAYHVDWNGGRMNGFLQGSGPNSLFYDTAAEMAPEWDWAQEYALDDHYYASALTETSPNRLYSLAGFSPVINDYGPTPYVPLSESIFGELDSYGVSWGYYVNDPSQGIGTLAYFQGFPYPAVGNFQDFTSELGAGTLPSVTFLMPVDGGSGALYAQGPPGNVLAGEMWLIYFVNAIMSSPEWNSTAIILTYDEGGGLYDQSAPPVVDGEQLGERVPMILISPYAKEDYVSHTVLNHASVLSLIDYNWGLPPLNPFVAASNLPLDMFDFSTPYPGGGLARSPLPFTTAEGFPVPSQVPFPQPSEPGPNLADLFPQPWQIPLAQLPYSQYGSSAFTLSSEGKTPFVTVDVTYTPLYQTQEVLGAIGFVELLLAVPILGGGATFARKRRRP